MAPNAARLADAYEHAVLEPDPSGEVSPRASWFATWLARHWCPGMVPPEQPPDVVSRDRLGREAMRWYQRSNAVLGAAVGARGCYVVLAEELGVLG